MFCGQFSLLNRTEHKTRLTAQKRFPGFSIMELTLEVTFGKSNVTGRVPVQNRISNNKLSTNTSSSLLLLVIFIITYKIFRKRRNKSKHCNGEEQRYLGIHDLPKIKNVVPFKLIGVMPRFLPFSRTLTETEKMSKEGGDLFYFQALMQDIVVFNSGPVLQALLKSTDFDHLIKPPKLYRSIAPFVKTGLLVSNGTFWQRQRKILMKSQSYQNLKSYNQMLNIHSKKFVENLSEMFGDGKPHQINALINISFLEIISEMITGKNLDRSKELAEYHHNFSIWKGTVVQRVFNPLLLIKPIWYLHSRSKIHGKAEAELFAFARKRLEEHKATRASENIKVSKSDEIETRSYAGSSFRCVLDELLDAGIDEEQIVQEVNVMMFGGHETGASTLHCLLYSFASNLEIQKLARQEVDELFDNPVNIMNGNLTFDSIQCQLKYMERCIFETLRLFPPVFIKGRKLGKPLQVEYKGETVLFPVGTNIAVIPFILHRREEYFPEPHKFDPDRFLPEETAKRHSYSYIPFSAGIRNCLGLKFAMVELKIIAAYILRHFEMNTNDKFEDIVLMPYTTLTPSKDFTFEFRRRCGLQNVID